MSDLAALTDAGLTRMARIEVVVDGNDEPAMRSLFLGAGASGYTAVTGVSGFGHHGPHQGRLLFNDRASLSLLITVVPLDRAPALIEGIRRLLDQQHGVLFVSEAYVSRPDYFAAQSPDT
jgi:nitrogen regulatory protein PII